MKRIRKWWAGRNRARFYRCRSNKCGYVWARNGKVWTGPYVPYEPGDEHVIMFAFGDFYTGIARNRSQKEVMEFWSDCWPLVEIKPDEMPRM